MIGEFDESILKSLRRITRAIDVYSRHLAAKYDLTGPQLVCLRQLLIEGPMAPSKLAAVISLSHPTVTGILDRLERRGLISRTRLKTDKRRVEIALTDEGLRLAKEAPMPLHQRFAERLKALPHKEQLRIDEVLRQMVQMMEVKDKEEAPKEA